MTIRENRASLCSLGVCGLCSVLHQNPVEIEADELLAKLKGRDPMPHLISWKLDRTNLL